MRKGIPHFLQHRRISLKLRQLLIEITDLDLMSEQKFSASCGNLLHQRFYKGRFPFAVGPDHRNLFALHDRQIDHRQIMIIADM